MRAYGLLQIARAYQTSDRKKAVELLEDALAASRGIDDDSLDTRKRLQQEILQAIVPLAPQGADEHRALASRGAPPLVVSQNGRRPLPAQPIS